MRELNSKQRRRIHRAKVNARRAAEAAARAEREHDRKVLAWIGLVLAFSFLTWIGCYR